MDALGLRRVRLIAHDWGAHAAFVIALQAPDRVSHLLAVNAAHPWLPQRRLLPQLWRFLVTPVLGDPGVGRPGLPPPPRPTPVPLPPPGARPAARRPPAGAENLAAPRH